MAPFQVQQSVTLRIMISIKCGKTHFQLFELLKLSMISYSLSSSSTHILWFPCLTVVMFISFPAEDMGYCMKWCGRPQWCLSPIMDDDGAHTDELVKDELLLGEKRFAWQKDDMTSKQQERSPVLYILMFKKRLHPEMREAGSLVPEIPETLNVERSRDVQEIIP